MRGFTAGFTLQLQFYRHHPDMWIPLLTSPLYMVIFSMIMRTGGRHDLIGYVLIAPFLMTLWWFALFHGGLVIQNDRWEGTVEATAAAPYGYVFVLPGRIAAVTVVGVASFLELWIFGTAVLGLDVTVHHPGLLLATLGLTAFAMTTTALFFAGLFVLARSATTFANSASYPFYLLGGVIVPVSLLPDWLRPVSKVVFLSWSADLFRTSVSTEPVRGVGVPLAMLALLGLVALGLASAMIVVILRRVRQIGELSFQ